MEITFELPDRSCRTMEMPLGLRTPCIGEYVAGIPRTAPGTNFIVVDVVQDFGRMYEGRDEEPFVYVKLH
jgi:hypothetical protein